MLYALAAALLECTLLQLAAKVREHRCTLLEPIKAAVKGFLEALELVSEGAAVVVSENAIATQLGALALTLSPQEVHLTCTAL